MRLTALVACFIACTCTLPVATAAEPEAKVQATCTKDHVSMCVDYLGAMTEKSEKICKDTKGVVAKGGKPCPTAKLVGTCAVTNFEGVKILNRYYEGAKDPKGKCDLIKGSWQPVAK